MKLRGSFQFDANFGDGMYNENGAETEFHKEWFAPRFLTKQIDETTSSTHVSVWDSIIAGTRNDMAETRWDRIYVDMKLPYDVDFRVGRWLQD